MTHIKNKDIRFYRIHEQEIAWATGKPRGIFVAVWKLLEKGVFTEEEKATYYENKKHFEKILPVPPFYESGNPEKAITWYKNTPAGNHISKSMTFYIEMAKKYGLALFKTSTTDPPGRVIYEDDYQIAVVDSTHEGDGFEVVPFNP